MTRPTANAAQWCNKPRPGAEPIAAAPTLITQVAQQMGLAKGRKRRADAGHSAITEAELDLIAGVVYHDRRHGRNMITVQAINMLHDDGKLSARLSASGHVTPAAPARPGR